MNLGEREAKMRTRRMECDRVKITPVKTSKFATSLLGGYPEVYFQTIWTPFSLCVRTSMVIFPGYCMISTILIEKENWQLIVSHPGLLSQLNAVGMCSEHIVQLVQDVQCELRGRG